MSGDLYDKDFYAWTKRQAELLKQGRWAELDVENVVEEIESQGRWARRKVHHHIHDLLFHLLHYHHHHSIPTAWIDSAFFGVTHAREAIEKELEESETLRLEMPEIVDEAYKDVVEWLEWGTCPVLPPGTLPSTCPWTLKQLMNPCFYADRTP